ncbi:hypothetical protein VSR34_37905, partial [Paraburkholderia sp. JHI2823]|uniref:hypothetical protein n=1 Tax=Paraburkholderia sp. JHI2823 TaxID=3112960 RepID=UPI00317C7FC8
SVQYPASSPYVVAVGGTMLSTTGTMTWAGETVWNDGAAYADLTNVDNERSRKERGLDEISCARKARL